MPQYKFGFARLQSCQLNENRTVTKYKTDKIYGQIGLHQALPEFNELVRLLQIVLNESQCYALRLIRLVLGRFDSHDPAKLDHLVSQKQS